MESFLSEPPRNGRGQYLMADEDGTVKPRTRATTFAEAASDKTGLVNWKLRTIVAGLVQRPDLYRMAAATHPDDRDALRKLADEAFQAGAGEAKANEGTARHEAFRLVALGQLTLGQLAARDAGLAADAAAYFRELARHGLTEDPRLMERTVFHRAYNVGGTLDRIVRYRPCTQCGRELRVLDIKTGRDLSYGEHEYAVQQWLYAAADAMFEPGSAERFEPMPEVCQHEAIIMHVPVGQGQAYAERIDISMGAWGARLCNEVRAWRSFKALRSPLQVGPPSQVQQVFDAILEPFPPMATVDAHATLIPGTDAYADPFAGIPTDDEEPFAGGEHPVASPMTIAPFADSVQPDPGEVYEPTAAHSTLIPGTDAYEPAMPETSTDQTAPTSWSDTAPDPDGKPATGPRVLLSKEDPEVERQAGLLLSSVPKSKGKTIMQMIARSLDPGIKQAQWAINIAKDIVRHPAWPDRALELIETYVPAKNQDEARRSVLPPEGVAAQEAIDGDVPLADRQNALADRHAARIGAAVDRRDQAANPFDDAQPVRGEQYYLTKVSLAESKRELAALWQDASDHGAEWTAKLNAAGMARMNQLNA